MSAIRTGIEAIMVCVDAIEIGIDDPRIGVDDSRTCFAYFACVLYDQRMHKIETAGLSPMQDALS
jgi:hypothetical protein